MKLAGLALVGAVLVLPGRAEADCGNPHWIGTPAGATLPPRGSLYVYDEHSKYDDTAPKSTPIVKRTKISDTVMRLDYDSKADELEIKLDDYDTPPVYNLDPKWRAPAALPRVLQYWHHVSEWTCSNADTVMIQIDQPTAAFRVRWQADGKPMQEWIIPARTGEDNRNVLELGKIDCGSTTIPPEEFAAGGTLTLFAIRYDGSEVVVTGLPPRMSTKDMVSSSNGIDQAIGYFENGEPVQPLPQAHTPRGTPEFPWTVFVIVMGILGPLLYIRFTNRGLKEV
jgi:hypothetical protein